MKNRRCRRQEELIRSFPEINFHGSGRREAGKSERITVLPDVMYSHLVRNPGGKSPELFPYIINFLFAVAEGSGGRAEG